MIRTRFAPSPTGSMHIGNLRTAFYAYALAKHDNGEFILRIEDTDKKREEEGGIEQIKSLLETFSIKWDEFYIQSQRLKLYQEAAKKLVDQGNAFYCQCEGKNAKTDGFSTSLRDECRGKGLTSGAIKLMVPENEKITFKDYVLNEDISWNTQVVFDATLLKSDGYPTYHLAVVVDDHDMKISHVLRGHDWLPSTPIHLLIYKFLGYNVPQIGHLTDILDPSGGKLSKRKGSASVKGLLAEGYLPQAIFNFVILAGWAPKDNQEIFDVKTFVEKFDPKGFQKSNPIFNSEKLDWYNGQYIQKLSDEEFIERIKPFVHETKQDNILLKIAPIVKSRLKKLSEFNQLAGFFFDRPKVDINLFGKNYRLHLTKAVEALESDKDLEETSKQNNFKTGEFFMDLRIAITGSKFTPPINESMIILGKQESLSRLKALL